MHENYDLYVGEIIRFGEGEYEDYYQFGDRIVLKNFNIQDEAKHYLDESKVIGIYDFLKRLDSKGLTKEVNDRTFYIGAGYVDNNQDFDWFENLSPEEVQKNIDDYYNERDEEDEEED